MSAFVRRLSDLSGRVSEALLVRHAIAAGHVAVVFRRRHVAAFTDLATEELTNYWADIQDVGRAIEAAAAEADAFGVTHASSSTGGRMNTCVALLRGINVGGKNSLSMKELVVILEGIGARNVKTYVQSGNVVFQFAKPDFSRLSKKITAAIKERCGFEPHVLILGLDAIEKAIARNPFPEAEADPSGLHLGFLAGDPKNPALDTLNTLKKGSERFRLVGSVFYLHAPEGVGRSKLAARSEKALGVPMTDRNWRTVCKIREMAREPTIAPNTPPHASARRLAPREP